MDISTMLSVLPRSSDYGINPKVTALLLKHFRCSILLAMKNQPTCEELRQLYLVDGLGILAIARKFRCRNGVIVKLIQEYGLYQPITEEWMKEQYVNQQKDVDEIAQLIGRDESTVRYYLRRFNIPIRYKSRGREQRPELNDREWLYEHYVVQRLSSNRIATLLMCADSSVMRALERHGIPRRALGHAHIPGMPAYSRRQFSHRKKRHIFTRDGHKCVLCGATDDLHAHHIIPVSQGGTNDLANGITLCLPCHQTTFGKELELAPQFQAIINRVPLT